MSGHGESRANGLVVDASVLLAWAVRVPQSPAAAALLDEGTALLAPESALAEALEGACALARDGHVSADDVAEMPRLIPPLLHALVADAPLMPRAVALAAEHDLRVPAAAALALAQARGAALATIDPALARVAREVLGAERARELGT